jgi:haloacetate dehalogenase
MFDGFDEARVPLDDATLHVRTAGDGPPLLLLHGYPQTGAAWARVAPALADEFTVVVPDLRGYGASAGPADPSAADYAKRTLAAELVDLMVDLGHETFALAGHDRGARVGYRLALDHPDRIQRLCVLDMIPSLEYYERATWRQSKRIYVWYLYPQPYPYPETLIGNAPDFHLEWLLDQWSDGELEDVFGEEALEVYRECMRDEDTRRAMMEDYRAGFHIDTEYDREDREAGNKITCPSLALYATGQSGTDPGPDPVEVWEDWMTDVRGETVQSSHFFPEEKPEETTDALESFFQS